MAKKLVSWSHGRLGNLMFIVASGKYYADKHNYEYYLLNSNEYDSIISTLRNGIFKNIKIIDSVDKKMFETVYEKSTYDPIRVRTDKNVYIEGVRECTKYWDDDKEYIYNLFRPEDGIIEAIKEVYKVDFSDYVCINVRRGDYIKENVKKRLGLLKLDFFYHCMERFPADQKYLIVSDDVDWCKKNFLGGQYLFVDKEVDGFEKIYVDLWIQTLCAHNIISNSTFSWWGAYLNRTPGRKVYYPYRFFKIVADRNKIPQNDNWIEVPAVWDDGIPSMYLKQKPKEPEKPKPSPEEKIMPVEKKKEAEAKYMKMAKTSDRKIGIIKK